METLKNIVGALLFAIFINVLGFQYLFGDIEFHEPKQISVKLELPDLDPLYNIPYVEYGNPELICMAENIFYEARNQSDRGMQAVGLVTLNRVKHVRFPDTVCDVVYEPSQFSWTLYNVTIDLHNPIERKAWHKALEIAYAVLNQKVNNDLLGVTHYHATYVNPQWGKHQVAQIDDHVFFYSN